MEVKAVRKVVEKHALKMMRAIGIPHWKVNIDYARLEGTTAAQCNLERAKYWIADITIDCEAMEDEADVLRCLRHELLHVLAAPFAHYRAVLTAAMDPESDEWQREVELWRFAMEQHVLSLEKGLAAEVGK